jgi:hypothetical protein
VRREPKERKDDLILYKRAGESQEDALKLCNFSHFCNNGVPFTVSRSSHEDARRGEFA